MRRLLIAILALTAAGCAARLEPTPPAPASGERFTSTDYDSYLARRTWSSKEELLQLYAFLDENGRARDLEIDPTAIARFSAMSTLFPMAECRGITCADGMVRLRFDSPQDAYVPGAFFQASLRLSREVAFRVTPVASVGSRAWVFTVAEGEFSVHFSWLAKALAPPFVRDFPIRWMEYRIDDHSRSSQVQAWTGTLLPPDRIGVERHGERIAIDLREPEHPLAQDIVLQPHRIELPCLGTTIDLLDGGRLSWDGKEPISDPPAHAAFSGIVRQAFADTDAFRRSSMRLAERYSYDLERRTVTYFYIHFDVVAPASPAPALPKP